MPSLPQVLHEATLRGASEVTLESDQHPMVKTDAGAVTVGEPLSESELFDALGLVLGPDQQAELALGNAVTFGLDVGGQHWGLVAEPASNGIMVRGRAGTDGAGRSTDDAASNRKLDLPKLDAVEPDRQQVPSTGKTILHKSKRQTQWDLGVPEAPAPAPSMPTPPPSKPSWSRHLAEDAASDFEIRTPMREEPASLEDVHDEIMTNSDADLAALVGPALAAQPDEPDADIRGSLEDFAPGIGPGSLCIVQGEGGAEALATAVPGGEYVLIDDARPGGVLQAAAELEPGGRFAIRLEDPSEVLGWILRRLEEGSRVVVQCRARTAPGARRVLLGVDASERAERWLSVHTMLFFAEEPTGWSLHEY